MFSFSLLIHTIVIIRKNAGHADVGRETVSDTSLCTCCGADTPLASLSNVSRSRPTTDPRCRFAAAWPMLDSLETIGRRRPRRISQHPPRAGARGYFDGTHRSRAEGGTGLSKQDPNPQG